MPEIGNLFVKISATTEEFKKKMDEVAGKLEATSKKFETAGQKMTDIGKAMSLRLTAPTAAVGTAAFAAANDLDKAMKTIRAGTGATGKALEALNKDFQAVFKQVPQGTDIVSSALADLNTRTGLTGQALQKLTKQTLDLARVAGTDASQLVAQTTRVFGDWGLETQKMGKTLDYLWKVSQTTGIGVEQLGRTIVQYGAPLRQMGFDFETAAAMLGKWEKEGVNAELVLGSLRIGLVNFAKAGEEPPKAMRRAIEEIKNMGSAAEANALAVKIFGARAGPDMAAAIREGRFDLDGLLKTLKSSPETIAAAARETMTFGESMQQLKNRAEVALEPLGKTLLAVFEKTQPQIEAAINLVSRLAEGFANLSPFTQKVILGVTGFAAVLGPLMAILGPVISAIGGVASAFGAMSAAVAGGATGIGILTTAFPALGAAIAAITGPVGIAVAAIGAVIAVGALLRRNWDEIKNAAAVLAARIEEKWTMLEKATIGAWTAIKNFVVNAFQWMYDHNYYFQNMVDLITNAWNNIHAITETVWNAVSVFLTNLWTRIRNTAQSIWGSIYGVIKSITDRIKNLFSDLVSSAYNWGRNLLSQFIKGIQSMISRLWDMLTDISKTVEGFLGFHSPTKLGPGREADKWAPNFVEMYAKGLESSLPKLQASMERLTRAMAVNFAMPAPVIAPAAGGGATITNYYQTFNITATGGTAGEQAEDLIRELARRGVKL